MIGIKAAEIAGNLGAQLTDKGIKLLPKKGTLIDTLTNAINNNNFRKDYRDSEIIGSYISSASEGVTSDNEAGEKTYVPSEHDTYMDDVLGELQQHISRYINFSRSVVMNEAKKFVEGVQNELANYKTGTAESFFDLHYYDIPDLFKDSVFVSELSREQGNTVKHSDTDINISTVTAENLNEFMLTGDPEEDVRVVSFLGSIGDRAVGYLHMSDFDLNYLDRIEMMNAYAVKALFYRNLALNTNLEAGLTVSDLKSRASSLRGYYGTQFYNSLNLLYRSIDTNEEVILNRPADRFSVYSDRKMKLIISEENFGKLAIKGGNIETIYGYAASTDYFDNRGNNVDALAADNNTYINVWSNTRSLYDKHVNSTMGTVLRNIAATNFDKSLRDEDSEDFIEFCNNNSSYLESIKSLANDYIAGIEICHLDKLNEMSIDLIAGIKYKYTNAYYILTEMNKELRANPDKQPEEAVWIAMIAYLLDFLVGQVTVA